MIAIKPEIGSFLLKTTNSVNLDDALKHLIKDYLRLKIQDIGNHIQILEEKYRVNFDEFVELYKKDSSDEMEEDFYKWDEVQSLYEYYKDLEEQWILTFENNQPGSQQTDWSNWVEEMYGCFREEPLQRYPQGDYESREAFS